VIGSGKGLFLFGMSLAEELAWLLKREFARLTVEAKRDGRLGLFECRCCLMSVYGVDKSEKAIAEVWLSLPSVADASMSDEEVLAHGVDFEAFQSIAAVVLEAEGIAVSSLGSRVYEAFDSKHKGFVSVADFERVLLSAGCSRLARRAPQLFGQLDELGIQKISVTQLKAALLRTRAEVFR